MPAHLRPLFAPKCSVCGKAATCTLYTHHNERISDFCKQHGEASLKTLLGHDERNRQNQG